MGKKYTPGYANLLSPQWENTALENVIKTDNVFRHLEDTWILWDQCETQFQTFFDILNTHSLAICLSARMEKKKILDFLDIAVSKWPQN